MSMNPEVEIRELNAVIDQLTERAEKADQGLDKAQELNALYAASLKKADAERDVARRDYEVMYRLYRGAKQERDEMAARAEILRKTGNKVVNYGEPEIYWTKAVEQCPEASLATLKAQWQVEALDSARIEMAEDKDGDSGANHSSLTWLMRRADQFRRQAEAQPHSMEDDV